MKAKLDDTPSTRRGNTKKKGGDERRSTRGEDVEEVGGEGSIFKTHGIVIGGIATKIIDRAVPDEFLIYHDAAAGERWRGYEGDACVAKSYIVGIVFFCIKDNIAAASR